ncbi:glutamine-rich protein 2 isoform X2 [Lepisosteus oculatus]|uniref:glutamine-rich protein 2 isoform X2 n=1 Tax=Lepisosteus oculatus TaxID=7918 RepID=UPI00370FA97E
MAAVVSLFDLANLAIGSPEVGAVNFNALHALLHAILRHLKIEDVTAEWRDEEPQAPSRQPPHVREKPSPYHHMEDKLRDIERQMAVLSQLPTGADLLTRSGPGSTPVSDMWQMMQLAKRVEANSDGTSKAMTLIQDVLKEINELKSSRDGLWDETRRLREQLSELNMKELLDKTAALEKCCHRVDNLEKLLHDLQARMSLYPEDLDKFITWEILQATLVDERAQLQEQLKAPRSKAQTPDQAPGQFQVMLGAPSATPPSAQESSSSPAQPQAPESQPEAETPLPFASPSQSPLPQGSPTPGPAASVPVPGSSPGQTSQTHPSGTPAQVPSPVHPGAASPDSPILAGPAPSGASPPCDAASPPRAQSTPSSGGPSARGSSRASSGADRYPETVEALRHVGQLKERHDALEERVELLERSKAELSQLQQLREHLAELAKRDLPDNLLEQLNCLTATVESLSTDREKQREFQKLFQTLAGASPGKGEKAEQGQTVDGEISFQILYLRSAVQDLEREVEELKREKQGRKERKEQPSTRTDKHLQEQLDKLRVTLESTISSSSTLLQRSLAQQEERQGQGAEELGGRRGDRSLGSRGEKEDTTYPSCCVDVSRKVSQLFQRYEELQGLVSSHLSRQGDRVRTGPLSQNSEVITQVQHAILQLQAECEKLSSTASHLLQEHGQKQQDIAHLYKSMEILEEKKADKDRVEMDIDVKADKRALELKEQDWQRVIEKISAEMDCKLDRIELEPLKRQLEDRWKAIRKQLQEQPTPQYELDDAAGIRKQLVARFHCISCDRPVDMLTPGPHVVTMPSVPSLPLHKSSRPYTVYELEQVRQHCRSLKPGSNQIHFEMAASEKRMVHTRQLHTLLCRQIDRVQSQFRGSERVSSQGYREHSQMRCTTATGLPHRASDSVPRHERIPELSDYGYLAVSRSCGGSHTLTFPSRRYTRLQHIAHFIQAEEEAQPAPILRHQPEEVDILGLDGHIYKGRLDTRVTSRTEAKLPTISLKDSSNRNKDRATRSLPQKPSTPEMSTGAPSRPQSAKTQRSRSASARSFRDRPMSSLGRLSQTTIVQHPTQSTSERQGTLEIRMDLNQSAEEEPLTTV